MVTTKQTAKHGVAGLACSLANELAPDLTRVNSVHPTNVRTEVIDTPTCARIFCPDLENPIFEDSFEVVAKVNMVPESYVDVTDAAEAVLFLASVESRSITGAALPVALGMSQKHAGS